jgi:hypothetical protein
MFIGAELTPAVEFHRLDEVLVVLDQPAEPPPAPFPGRPPGEAQHPSPPGPEPAPVRPAPGAADVVPP